MTTKQIENIYEICKKNKGITLTKALNIYSGNGYAISKPGYEKKIKDVSLSKFHYMIKIYQKKVSNRNEYIGIWIENDIWYFDISLISNNLDKAKELAKEYNQIAIFDFNTFKTIYMEGN